MLGDKQRRKVLGDAHVDKCLCFNCYYAFDIARNCVETLSIANAQGVSDFMRSAQVLVTEAAW